MVVSDDGRGYEDAASLFSEQRQGGSPYRDTLEMLRFE